MLYRWSSNPVRRYDWRVGHINDERITGVVFGAKQPGGAPLLPLLEKRPAEQPTQFHSA